MSKKKHSKIENELDEVRDEINEGEREFTDSDTDQWSPADDGDPDESDEE